MADSARFVLVDVFTDRPFGGNQLAVFTDGGEVPEALMQPIARELNFSETTYVLAPEDPAHDARLRIFTPLQELPTAGHPTVGTAHVLAAEGRIETGGDRVAVVFEEGVGPIRVEIELDRGAPRRAVMEQPLPRFGPRFAERDRMAAMLTLAPEDIAAILPLEVISCGMAYLFVPLASRDALRRAKLRMDLWQRHLASFATPHVYLFHPAAEAGDVTVHARMFAPAAGVLEDPATGSASGPLGCYLVRHGLVDGAAAGRIVCMQGVEMGRPSRIEVAIETAGGEIRRVRVGGRSVIVGEGTIRTGEIGRT